MSDNRRNQLIEFVEREFIGPDPVDWPGLRQENGEEILITDPPRVRYVAGILCPAQTTDSQVEVQEDECSDVFEQEGEDKGASSKQGAEEVEYLEDAEELINRSNAYRQSAISVTAAVQDGDSVKVKVTAGIYHKLTVTDSATGKKSDKYLRTALEWDNDSSPILLPLPNEGVKKMPIGTTGLQFDVTYRYRIGESIIYTFTLENAKLVTSGSVRDEDCFFQCKFKLFSDNGFAPLADAHRITEDEDYLSNQLLYRDIKNYAIGHGCAADWDDEETVKWISTAVFPTYDIKPIVPSVINGVSLEMLKMSPYGCFEDTVKELRLMCEKYREWINELRTIRSGLSAEYKITADRHISNCETCLSRMEKGIDLLEQNEMVRIAFQHMNLAMLMQQLHYNLPLQRWEDDGEGGIKLINPVDLPNVTYKDTWYGDKERYGKWRPFQLAFVLMNLKSMYDRDCAEREIVDLIWFPTGGGKTEAYLGLSAYTIFIRRLLNKEDKGTSILMRYTLRLLTAQQYERASAMICACEIIRKGKPELFGQNRITIGLWVGGTTTPNSIKEAIKDYEELYQGGGKNPFVILKCPWCGAQMGPVIKRDNRCELPGYKKIRGPRKTNNFAFRCSNDCCDFSSDDLPLYVIDEHIYANPPTVLLGTVDKFAMLPFRPEAQTIFGYVDGIKVTSPDLIIQDELHLISGPLGSMVGHYETLINELCTVRTVSGEIRPKIVASTATISRAKEQCHSLYGCDRSNVFQFPPSGLTAGNSFFAEERKDQNGRRYVGIFASSSTSDASTAIRLYSALLYGAKALEINNEEERDPYWTNMGYFNSIRELGQASTWIQADIDQYLDVIYKRRFDDKRYATPEEYRKSRRYIYKHEELTSRKSGSEVTSSLADLSIRYTGKSIDKDIPMDICLATNMISVGLDVSRLGLMTVAGQPKTTSEYIQATSRVGRNAKDAPGLVFVLYRPGRPRDKSHYEHFKSYHSRVYCNVEPTSVTPFSAPVRERALHAIMVGMMRLQSDDGFNADPPSYPQKDLIDKVFNIIENRVDNVDDEELAATVDRMEYIMQCWKDWNPKKWEPVKNKDRSFTEPLPLMYPAGSFPNEFWRKQGIETPTSMRNVDAACEAEVLSNHYTSKEEY